MSILLVDLRLLSAQYRAIFILLCLHVIIIHVMFIYLCMFYVIYVGQ